MPNLLLVLMVLPLFLVSTYALFTLTLWVFWLKIPRPFPLSNPPTTLITVIIAVRNEANHIGALLKDLGQQSYDQALFEVIVANDGSTDNTAYVLDAFKKNTSISLTIIELDQNIKSAAPKKRAIQAALEKSKGIIIVTTDGDCRVGPDWLRSIAEAYESSGAKLISGPVTFTAETSLTDHLQTVEFSSLIGSGAASIVAGSPSMCNGANLAYEKKAFEKVGGFAGNDHIASGDDEFLMHKIAERYPGRVLFLKDKRAIVRTAPHRRWQDFFQQRKRWASKWKHYQNPVSMALAIYIFCCNATLIAALISGIIGWLSWPHVLVVFMIKWIPEWLFIGSVLLFSNKSRSIIYILLVQIFYPFYVTLFGVVAQRPSYTWKDRELT